MASLAGVTVGSEGVAEAVMGAGLPGLVANLQRQAERGVMLGAGVSRLASGEERTAETVERIGFAGPVTGLAAQGQRPLELAGGLPVTG